jgi:antibiotic biosynthesis monooxygenase
MTRMSETSDPKTSFLSYSRWSLRRGGDLGRAVEVFRDLVKPAYTGVDGCLSVTLLDLVDSQSYLAVAAWDTRDDYDAWVRNADDWREANADAFKKWQELMELEEDFQASVLG